MYTIEIRIIVTAVTVSVVQRMASFCSLGMSMMPSVAIAGKKTIKESKKTALMGSIPVGSQFSVVGGSYVRGQWASEGVQKNASNKYTARAPITMNITYWRMRPVCRPWRLIPIE